MGSAGPDFSYPFRQFDASYMIAIPFLKSPFLAPAFESYLLAKYRFPINCRLAGTRA
jgi:hypothetical protein